ncbi:MAG: orotidine-5'-phosphate decarboxylase [Anaerolineales bacterium]
MDFWEKLKESIRRRDSLLCVGLDPRPEMIPSRFGSVVDFNRAIIDATADLACVYKPNIAFYEALGEEGMRALRGTLTYIPDDVPVLLDAKRNDIGSTATAYAKACYEVLGVDAVTVTPYLGSDGVTPFTAYEDRGVFLLCKTSNPGAGEVQDWAQQGEPLYRHIVHLARGWAEGREIGLVIGATYPEAIADIRQSFPEMWFLVPGVGAQGGDVDAVLSAGLRPDGVGLVINSSRGIIYADDPREAARDLRDRINEARYGVASDVSTFDIEGARLRTLARGLFEAGCVRFGDFVLHSGAHSPVYVDLRRLVGHPRLLVEVAQCYGRLLHSLRFDRMAAIPTAGLPIGTAVALETGYPLIYPRRRAKSYGTQRLVEGEYAAGDHVVVLDDLITSGGSKMEAIEPLEAEDMVVKDVVVLIDREQGGAEILAEHGYHLHALFTLRELVKMLAQDNRISLDEERRVLDYLEEEG